MARPKLPESKDVMISFRCTEAEAEKIAELHKLSGIQSRSKCIVELLMELHSNAVGDTGGPLQK